MKNILIIDGADNCVYDIYTATNEEFDLIFVKGTDIAFIDEVYTRHPENLLDATFKDIWRRRCRKSDVLGIHGTLFFEMDVKKQYYPTRRDEEAINPDGTRLR